METDDPRSGTSDLRTFRNRIIILLSFYGGYQQRNHRKIGKIDKNSGKSWDNVLVRHADAVFTGIGIGSSSYSM